MHIDLTRPETLSGAIERLCGNNVLVLIETRADREGYHGPLVLPDIDAKGTSEALAQKQMFGRVLMVGPDVRDIAPGDRVVTNMMAGDPVWIGGKEHRIIRHPRKDSAILGVVE